MSLSLGITSILQAECLAIIHCLNTLKQMNIPPNDTIHIITDSQSIIQLTQQSSIQTITQQSLINALMEWPNISLQWTKAHSGNPGNDPADSAAKHARNKTYRGTPYPIDRNSYKQHIQSFIWKEWQHEWEHPEGALHFWSFLFSPINNHKLGFITQLSKPLISRFVWFITGHCYLANHESKFSNTPPTCRLCSEDAETPLHLIQECPVLLNLPFFIHLHYF